MRLAVAMNSREPRPNDSLCVVWTNDSVPADNFDPADGALKAQESRVPNGAAFRIIQHAPGRNGRLHRTQTVDYGIVLSGSIVMVLDDGVEVTLNAGDAIVQRGTNHNWINRGQEPCTIAFVLVDAKPIEAR